MIEELRNDLLDYLSDLPSTGKNPRISPLEPLQEGWASDIYRFTLTFDKGKKTVEKNLVIKTYTNSSDGKDRALKEKHALSKLNAAKYPVPDAPNVEIDPDIIGRPFVIMEYIEGTTMMTLIEDADPGTRQQLIKTFVGLLTDLHDLGPYVLVPSMKKASQWVLVNREIYTMRGLIQTYDLSEFSEIVEWLYDNRKRVPCDSPVVTHRDFHPWNVMMTDDGAPYVLDWGWQISDPRFDIAWTVTLLERSGYAELADEILTEYETVTGASVDELDYFKVLATTRWLINIVNSLRSGNALREGAADDFRIAMQGAVSSAVALIEAQSGVKVAETGQLLA